MMCMEAYPKIKAVQPLADKRLRVTFVNDQVRVYDCIPLLDIAAFQLLRDDAFFRSVSVDPHGYGIMWNHEVDLAESELWLHGVPEATTGTDTSERSCDKHSIRRP